ncbi:hypothetical protein AYI70_g11690, partial [Smittium culicis]
MKLSIGAFRFGDGRAANCANTPTKPDTGVEPVALRLKASRSTIELTGHLVSVRFELTPLSRPQLECGALDRSAKIPVWGLRGLNSGPYDLQSHALPAELSPHIFG